METVDLRLLSDNEVALFFYDTARTVAEDEWEARWMAAIACLESGYGRHYIDCNVVGYHYIEGMGWEYVKAKEGMTGSQRKYRKFNSFAECFSSLYYLLDKSSAAQEYIESRSYNTRTADGRRKRIRKFSEGYCPADKSHGRQVYKIYKDITKLVADVQGRDSLDEADLSIIS